MKKLILTLACFIALGASAQDNVTNQYLRNSSFEAQLSNWLNDGFQAQNNTDFTLKVGTWYAEKWTPVGGHLDNARIRQSLTNLVAGTYTLSAKAQNIQQSNNEPGTGAYLYGGQSRTEVTKADSYDVTFTVVDGKTDVGMVLDGCTGNWAACDQFTLYYTFNVDSVNTRLQALIDNAEAYKADGVQSGEAFNNLNTAIANVKANLNATSGEGITSSVQDLEDAVWKYRLASATPEKPIDFTNNIVNPDFENSLTGWNNDNMSGQNNTAFSLKHGNSYAESWIARGKKIGNASITQSIGGLEKGRYLLKVNAQNIQEDNLNQKQTGATVFAEAVEDTVTSAAEYQLTFTSIESSLNIGFRAENATGNWLAVDNFRLYFIGGGDDVVKAEMQRRIDEAKDLLNQKMNTNIRSTLESNVSRAENVSDADFSNVAALLRIAVSNAKKSVLAHQHLQQAIADAEAMLSEGWQNGTKNMQDAIDRAKAIEDDLTLSASDLEEEVQKLEGAKLVLRTDNGTGTAPVITTDHRYARGNDCIFGRMTATGDNIIEQGFCYSESPEPTIADNRATRFIENNGRIYVIEDVKPGTIYYIRPYALTSTYDVGYGDIIKAITLPKSDIVWHYDNNGNPDENNRMLAAINGWYYYWSRLTSIRGYRPTFTIAYGTPTADCSYGGYSRYGSNPTYQSQTYVTHEMLHGIGVGTSSVWAGQGGLRSNGNSGTWLGERVTNVIQFWRNNGEMLQGDPTHMWPDGFNYPNEDSHTEQQYTENALIAQALGEDGLAPTGGFPTAAYTFEQEDTKKYYLTNEDEAHGLGTTLLAEGPNGTLVYKKIDGMDAISNDSVAWYITFNPQTQFYAFRNAATGKYIMYNGSFQLRNMLNLTPANYFQMMKGRIDANIKTANNGNLVKRGYWIVHNENKWLSPVLGAGDDSKLTTLLFDLGNNARTERWVVLTSSDLSRLGENHDYDILLSLKVNNEPIKGFKSSVHNYIYEIAPESTTRYYSVGCDKAYDFVGSVKTSRPRTIPGYGTVTVTDNNDNVTTYSILFLVNYIKHWNADGATGIGSQPNNYGWAGSALTDWYMSNTNNKNLYVDPYESDYNSFMLGDEDYDARRMIFLNYGSTDEFTYTFNGLKAKSSYDLKATLGLAEGDDEQHDVTIGVYDKSTGEKLAESTVNCNGKKQLQSVTFKFDTPESYDGGDLYVSFKADKGDYTIAAGDLIVTPDNDLVTGINDINIIDGTGNAGIYTLDGRKVSTDSNKRQTLAPGVYIIGNKKIVIK